MGELVTEIFPFVVTYFFFSFSFLDCSCCLGFILHSKSNGADKNGEKNKNWFFYKIFVVAEIPFNFCFFSFFSLIFLDFSFHFSLSSNPRNSYLVKQCVFWVTARHTEIYS